MGESIPLASRIHGVGLVSLRQIEDDRGAVLHLLRSDSPQFTRFGECYCSEVRPGKIKAWKQHRVQTQHLAVPTGRVRFVIYDSREDSPSYGAIETFELGRPDAYLSLCIPPGLWYGFVCVSATPALIVNCVDVPHEPGESVTLAASDAQIPYRWKLPEP